MYANDAVHYELIDSKIETAAIKWVVENQEMNYSNARKLLPMLITIVGLSACASKNFDPVKTANLRIQVSQSDEIKIVNVQARQSEYQIEFYAKVKPRGRRHHFFPGHIRFELFANNGEQLLNLDATQYFRGHSHDHKSKLRHVSFVVNMPFVMPRDATLKVSHHRSDDHGN